MTTLTKKWGSLTQSQRDSYNNAVSTFAKTDIFGDIRNPSGINLFTKLNSIRLLKGQAVQNLCPEKTAISSAQLTNALLDLSANELWLTLDQSITLSEAPLVRSSGPIGAGVSFVKNKMRIISANNATLDPIDLYNSYVAKFGTPSPGQKVNFSLEFTNAGGEKSTQTSVFTLAI